MLRGRMSRFALRTASRAAFVVCWCCLSSVSVRAQELRLGAALGTGWAELRDERLRGLRWQGPEYAIGSVLERSGERSRFDAELRLGAAVLRNRYWHDGVMLSTRVGTGYLWRLPSRGRGRTTLVGGRLEWHVSPRSYYDWDEEHLYWLTTIVAGPELRHEEPVGEHQAVIVDAVVPVVGLVATPPERRYYKTDDLRGPGAILSKAHEGMKAALPPDYLGGRLRLFYSRTPPGRFGVRVGYEFAYRRASEPVVTEELVHSCWAELAWSL
jgi:hypothetical protein